MFLPLVTLLWLLAEPTTANPSRACEPDAAAGAVLQQVGQVPYNCRGQSATCERQRSLMESAVSNTPDDVFLHEKLQDVAGAETRGTPEAHPLVDRYAALRDKEPQRALWPYLLARLVRFEKPEEAFALDSRAAELDPSFPPAQLALARWRVGVKHRDPAKAMAHIEAFTRLCPGSLAIYEHALRLPTPDAARHAARLRAILEQDPGVKVGWFDTLWTAEFRLADTRDHEAVRSRVRADLARIKARGQDADPEWWQTLARAHGLVGDEPGRVAAKRELIARLPCLVSADERRELWDRDHPEPRDAKVVYATASEWARLCPERLDYVAWRFELALPMSDLPDSEFVAATRSFLDRWAGSPELGRLPSLYFTVAEAYLARGVELDAIETLTTHGIEDTRRQARSLGFQDERAEGWRLDAEWRALVLHADLALKRRDPKAAAQLVSLLQSRLAAPPPKLSPRGPKGRKNDLALLEAALAEAQGRTADAVALYRTVAGTPRADIALIRLTGEEFVPIGPRQSQLTPWDSKNERLPDLDLLDLAGRRWTREDFAGRTTLIGIWSHYFSDSLEQYQQLYDKVKDRPDLQVVALNIDDNTGEVLPAMTRHGCTVPVLFGAAWFHRLNRAAPRLAAWVVDADGTVRFENRWSSSEWVEAALLHMKLAATKTAQRD